MIGILLILGGYAVMVALCLWLQAVHYKLDGTGMKFDGFNILYAFLPFSFVGPLFAVAGCFLEKRTRVPAEIQKLLTPK